MALLRRGDGLGEGDEVAAGALDAEFVHAVKGSADGHDDFHVLHGREDGIEIVDRLGARRCRPAEPPGTGEGRS